MWDLIPGLQDYALGEWIGQAAWWTVLWSRSWKLGFKCDIYLLHNLGKISSSLDLLCRVGVDNSILPSHHQRHLLLSIPPHLCHGRHALKNVSN